MSGILRALRDHAKSDSIQVLMTDITVKEIRANIANEIKKAKDTIAKLKDKARIMRNNTDEFSRMLFTPDIDVDALEAELNQQFDEFLEDAVDVLPISSVPTEEVFDRYFNREPPFGEGKKKSEFPDAFAVAAIERWAIDNETNVCVASGDSGLREYADRSSRLTAVEDVGDALDAIITEDVRIASSLKAALNYHRAVLEDRIREQFSDLGFYLEDQEGDAEDVSAETVTIKHVSILRIDESTAEVQLGAVIKYSAHVIYPDPEFTAYDSETGEFITFHSIEERVQREAELAAIVDVVYEKEGEHVRIEIEDVSLLTREIPIRVNEDWPYM